MPGSLTTYQLRPGAGANWPNALWFTGDGEVRGLAVIK